MDSTSLETLSRWMSATLLQGDATATTGHICTDTRALKAGDLFLALSGENFNGHTFLNEAAKRGAIGAVVSEDTETLPADFAVLRVPDTLVALQNAAAAYRQTLPLQVVCITGSNGKTSTKDLVAGVLSERLQVSKTEGNLNNHIGLPQTVLKTRSTDQVGVWEIGMNHPGEIAPLAAIAAPDVAIITNIGMAHIEFMGTRENIAKEKGMLAEALKPGGHVILSAEDDFSESIAKRTSANAIYTGIDKGDISATNLVPHLGGVRFTLVADGQKVDAEIPVPGVHMVRNALHAVAVGRIFGLSLEECAAGLKKLQLTKGRLEQKIVRGIHILDDTYNANPDSVAAALRTLSQVPATGRRIAVLGRMGELGDKAEDGHRSVGTVAAEQGLDGLIGVGEEARWITEAAQHSGMENVQHCESVEDGVKALIELARDGDIVLVKGSRSARMERIVEGLQTT
jgi:UDP-N-acetylmuramoyl-tripeptide--D-alanyl-D-alanine ligase